LAGDKVSDNVNQDLCDQHNSSTKWRAMSVYIKPVGLYTCEAQSQCVNCKIVVVKVVEINVNCDLDTVESFNVMTSAEHFNIHRKEHTARLDNSPIYKTMNNKHYTFYSPGNFLVYLCCV